MRCIVVPLAMTLLHIVQPQATSSTFEQRSQWLSSCVAAKPPIVAPKHAFWYAQAKFLDGDTAGARLLIDQALDGFSDNDPSFQLWAGVDCYLRWNHLYDQALKTKTQRALVGSPYYGTYNTENKILMAAAARYLAGQLWPSSSFASSFSAQDPTGKETLIERAALYVRHGEREHNSPTYFGLHYGSLRTVADFAIDKAVARAASMAAEWMLASAAGEWFEGHWPASSERTYDFVRAQNFYRAGTSLLWAYFGGLYPVTCSSEMEFGIIAFASPYRLPAILASIASDRSSPFLHREYHDWPVQFCSSTYFEGAHAVFSVHVSDVSWPRWLNQMHAWGVCWKQPSGKSVFMVQHPRNTKVAGFGATPYEHLLQHKSTIVAVYNVPPSDSNPYIVGQIPSGFRACIDESDRGRVALAYDSVLICLQLSHPFEWDSGAVSFTLPIEKAGLSVEVTAPNSFQGSSSQRLRHFYDAIRARTHLSTAALSGSVPCLTYTALDGSVMQACWNGENRIDGSVVDYAQGRWPLLDNPWMKQRYGSDTLIIKKGDTLRVYDFAHGTVTESRGSTLVSKGVPTITPDHPTSSTGRKTSRYTVLGRLVPAGHASDKGVFFEPSLRGLGRMVLRILE